MSARERANVFGEVAEQYDRARPSYPTAMVDHVLTAVDDPRRIIDAGAGTGKATALFAAHGFDVLAIEPDARMAEICGRNVPTADVRVGRFEDAELPEAGFDVGLSAQAWHWIDPERGAEQMGRAIRPGGVLALMWNWPGTNAHPARSRIEEAYREHAPELVGGDILTAPQVLADEHFAPLVEWFSNLPGRSDEWVETYTAEQYALLTQTHSPHRLLPAERRARLAAAVAAAIDEVGGAYDYPYVTELRRFRRR